MKISPDRRKKMEKTTQDTFNILDPTGTNSKKYKEMLSSMTQKEFDEFFTELFNDDNLFLILDVVDYERELDIEKLKKAAEYLGVPLTERIIMPHLNMDKENPIVTKVEAIVGYIVIKRVQQMVMKKNSASTDIGERSPVTGQVTGDDKNARSSDQENIALCATGAWNVLQEFLGPRADGLVRKNQMYADITNKGYCSLSELDADISDRTTLNTIDVLFLGMGIKTDLVSGDLLLPQTAKNIKNM